MIQSLTVLQSDTLRELAARLALKGLTTQEIVSTADELLRAGVYDDALLGIVDSHPPILSSVEPLFRRFLAAASIPVPDRETSVWQLLYFHIRRIAQHQDDPFDALNDLINDVYYHYPFQEQPGSCVGESHGIQHLIGNYAAHDDLFGREKLIIYDGKTGAQVLSEARESLKRSAQEWLNEFEKRPHR